VERPDERNLLAYLLVLDVLVLLAARFRTWPALNRLAWLGSALLVLPTLLREPEAPRPLARLLLLSALFLIFLVVPLFRERVEGLRIARLDLVLVVANAAAYFWAVYVTLGAWHPWWEGPYALALAVLYRLVSADYASRVPDDRVTVDLHEGVSWTFLTLAVPLALDAQWVTLAWAVQGVMLLWLSSRSPAPVAAWAGLAVLLVAAFRAVGSTSTGPPRSGRSGTGPLVHLLVVVAWPSEAAWQAGAGARWLAIAPVAAALLGRRGDAGRQPGGSRRAVAGRPVDRRTGCRRPPGAQSSPAFAIATP
jgi:uncharacterized membrane protein